MKIDRPEGEVVRNSKE